MVATSTLYAAVLRSQDLSNRKIVSSSKSTLRHATSEPFLAAREVIPDNSFVYRAIAIALICAFFVTSARAVRELVVIEELQPAQRVEGVVLDPSGAPIPNMRVTDRTEKWVAVLRSTTTDSNGHFRFSSQRATRDECVLSPLR